MEEQKCTLWKYIERLDIGKPSAKPPMIEKIANYLLWQAYNSFSTLPAMVGSIWVLQFLVFQP